MSVSSLVNRNDYSGNDLTTQWPYTFPIATDDGRDIEVWLTSPAGVSTETTNFTVDVSGAEVIYPTVVVPATDPLPAGWTITLLRVEPLTQGVDLITQGSFNAEVIETALDKVTMICQQLQEESDRSIKVGLTEDDATSDILIAQINTAVTAAEAAEAAAAVSAAAALVSENNAAASEAAAEAAVNEINAEIKDTDDDTKIETEKNADEDIIRFSLGDATLSAAREVVTIQAIDANDVKIEPTTDDDVDLGSASKEFKNLYIDGTANIDSLVADTADINGGTLGAITIDGNWTALGQTCANLGAVTTTGAIGLGGKLTAGANEIECSNVDITGGSVTGITDLAIADGGTGISTDDKLVQGWVNFQGSATINDSYNVDSVTDNGVGEFAITWTTDFASTNYSISGACLGVKLTSAPAVCIDSLAVGVANIYTMHSSGAVVDGNPTTVIAVGNR